MKSLNRAQGGLAALAPVGWPSEWRTWLCAHPVRIAIGWLLTALAELPGAPFCFDTLQSLVNVRNAGPKPASSTTISG